MRVIFLNRYFYPDHSATSQMLSDLAFFVAGTGHEVCAGRPVNWMQDVFPEVAEALGVIASRAMASAAGRRDVKPLLSHRFRLEQAEEAYALVAGGGASLGILLQYATLEQRRACRTQVRRRGDRHRYEPKCSPIGM